MPQVRDLMTPNPVTVEPSTTAIDAAKVMIENKVGPLPVVEGDRAVGIVTDRDLIAHVLAEGRDPQSTTVDEIATKDLVTAAPDMDLDDASQLLVEHQLDRLVILEEGKLVGILSEADIPREIRP